MIIRAPLLHSLHIRNSYSISTFSAFCHSPKKELCRSERTIMATVPSGIIRNPYAKKCKNVTTTTTALSDMPTATTISCSSTQQQQLKRTDRPWENQCHYSTTATSSSGADSNICAGNIDTVQAQQPPSGQLLPNAGAAIYSNSAAAGSTSAAAAAAAATGSSAAVQTNDAGAAARIAMTKTTTRQPGVLSAVAVQPASATSTTNANIVRPRPAQEQTAATAAASSFYRYSNTTASNNTVPRKTAPSAVTASANISMPPRPPQQAQQQQQQPSSIVASLRPASWNHQQKKPLPSSPATSVGSTSSSQFYYASANHNFVVETTAETNPDPRQASLPRELQFRLDDDDDGNNNADATSSSTSNTGIIVADEHRADLVKHAALSQPLNNGWTLFSHQKRAILAAILTRRKILALDMGLGKTLIGCCWARAFVRTFNNSADTNTNNNKNGKIKVIVLCPVSLKSEWKRTAEEATGLTVQPEETAASKKKKKDDDDDGEVMIASWAKVPDCFTNSDQKYVVIADEAHSMQNMTSARTRDALRLMLAPNAIGVLLLTGTPMKNGKPANLFPLLKAVKHPFGNHQRAYEAHFCGGRDVYFGNGGRPVWQATGAANLDQLRELTQSHLLHLTKDECLKNLPPQTRVFKTIPVSSRSQMRHNEAMQKLAKVYEKRHEAHQEAVLGAVQNLRMVDSLAKVDATVEVVKQVLEKEPAVVIFTSFVEVAKLVHQKLGQAGWNGELLTGETPAKKRQAMVDNFQNGLSPVFVCTFGAGGVGLTLTAAATVVLLDRPWTPGDAHQAEDRVRRIGQTKPVTSIWMSAFELDRQIDSMLECKSQTSSTVLASSNNNSSNIADDSSSSAAAANDNMPKLSILKLLQSVLPPPSATNKSSSPPDGLKQTTMLQYSQNSPSCLK